MSFFDSSSESFGGRNASLDVLAFGGVTPNSVSGVIEFSSSMRHQFWNIVSYKFGSQICVSSFIGFMFVFGTNLFEAC